MSVPLVWSPLDSMIDLSVIGYQLVPSKIVWSWGDRVCSQTLQVAPDYNTPQYVVVIILSYRWRFSKCHSGILLESIPGANTLTWMTIVLIGRHGAMVVILLFTGVQ